MIEVRPDLDRIDALSDERAALWSRINAATFLTEDEKREAVGYGALGRDQGTAIGAAAAP
jgi:phage portal protein BeeE